MLARSMEVCSPCVASNPGFPFRILLRSFGDNPERKLEFEASHCAPPVEKIVLVNKVKFLRPIPEISHTSHQLLLMEWVWLARLPRNVVRINKIATSEIMLHFPYNSKSSGVQTHLEQLWCKMIERC